MMLLRMDYFFLVLPAGLDNSMLKLGGGEKKGGGGGSRGSSTSCFSKSMCTWLIKN